MYTDLLFISATETGLGISSWNNKIIVMSLDNFTLYTATRQFSYPFIRHKGRLTFTRTAFSFMIERNWTRDLLSSFIGRYSRMTLMIWLEQKILYLVHMYGRCKFLSPYFSGFKYEFTQNHPFGCMSVHEDMHHPHWSMYATFTD